MLKRTEMIFHNGYKRVVFLLCFFARVPAWQNIGEMIFLTHQGRRTFLHCEWADLSSLLRISKSFLTGSAGEGFLYCIIMLVTSQIQQYGKWFPTKTSQHWQQSTVQFFSSTCESVCAGAGMKNDKLICHICHKRKAPLLKCLFRRQEESNEMTIHNHCVLVSLQTECTCDSASCK